MNTDYFSLTVEEIGDRAEAFTEANFVHWIWDEVCPCDLCPLKSKCAVSSEECVAFRNYASSGNFNEKDRMRLLRVPRMRNDE